MKRDYAARAFPPSADDDGKREGRAKGVKEKDERLRRAKGGEEKARREREEAYVTRHDITTGASQHRLLKCRVPTA